MTDLSTKISHLNADVTRFGWYRSLVHRFFVLAARYLGIHVHVVRIKEMVDEPEYPSQLTGITYRVIENDELREVSADPELVLSRDFVNAAIERGDTAFGAFDGSRMVSYVWRSESEAPHEKSIWVRVRSPYCYAYKSYTRPSHRGQHISPGVHLSSDIGMLKRGYTFRVGFVEISNWASLAMGKHMGAQIIGKAGYLLWFGKCIPFRTREVKAVGFEFFDRDSTHLVN